MRHPIASGRFYPENRISLMEFMKKNRDKGKNAFACVCPHAGYSFSGSCAARTVSSMKKAGTFIILGPNHTGLGEDISVSGQEWETPLGTIEPDTKMIKKLGFPVDETAHKYEHSIEVLIPFIQYYFKGSKFVPICIKKCNIEETSGKIAKAIGKDVGIIASSDLIHYGKGYGFTPFPPEKATEMNLEALERIQELDLERFRTIAEKTTICGRWTVTLLMRILQKLNIKKGEIIGYCDSGMSKDNFVGYGGVIF